MQKYSALSALAITFVVGVMTLASADVRAASDWIQQLDTRCNAGDGGECGTLGNQLMGGYVVPKDPERARAAFEKGCAADDLGACIGLYRALSLGQGGPQDLVRARTLAAKACHTGILAFDVSLENDGLCKE